MSSALLLALLGITLTAPRVRGLTCQSGTLHAVRNVSDLPLQWTASQDQCEDGWGCLDVLILTKNGPLVDVVVIKGCVRGRADHEAHITQHRAGPGLSITSYTRVCREDLCNSLSNSLPLWTPSQPTVLGSVRCPVCLSAEDCPSAAEMTCPAESSHCYSGVLLFKVGNRPIRLRVRGCMSQAGCNLLNGTQEIGPISVQETCDSTDFLTCHRGNTLQISRNLIQEPTDWSTSGEEPCNPGEMCQETLLLIDVGLRSVLMGSKGCIKARTQDSRAISIHSGPPGVFVASYVRFCSSNWCNSAASSSVLLNSLPRPAPPAPGDLECPTCLSVFGSCKPEIVRCPKGTSRCYKGHFALRGGGLSSPLNIQGCVAQPSLLNRIRNIGVFSVIENRDGQDDVNEPILQGGAAPAPYLP
ncbi:CD177 antigen [Hippopotamus amphibius kiboko]|uniref:CD177 antigen n=1 Tax=Hippopotamus amphibius kiboko TaxID=575201 RepID=UPI002598BFA3|nr:CD177 antigen [Hippopotamus amphibius kiboko]